MNYKQALAGLLAGHLDIPETDAFNAIETPPDAKLGHFAYPCFKLAKQMRKAPQAIAGELAGRLMSEPHPDWLTDARATGAYVNLFLDRTLFAGTTLTDVLSAGENYGRSTLGEGKTVLVEYASPNTSKHFHVGHLGTSVIGHTLYNIFTHLGYNTVGINYLGDWGTSFGKLITAYLRWGVRAEVEETGIDALTRLYVRFHEEAEHDASLADEARAWVVKMQNGDEEGLSLWKWFCDLSFKEYKRIYDRLGIRFDLYRGESYYSDKMQAVFEELDQKGLLVESEGAKIVDLESYGMPPCLILRSDGGTLYPTRDIAAAIDRYNTFHFDKSLYVTDSGQMLHFAQWMKVVELMGYPWAKDMAHVSYGVFMDESGRLSTRKGHVIKLESLLDDAVEKTLAIIREKNPDLPDKETVAEQVGIGAVIFNELYNSRVKDVLFSWDRMLNFEGETGPYVQYTHTRACSVLEKAAALYGYTVENPCADAPADGSPLTDDEAFEVLRLLHDFPSRIEEAADKYEPFVISRHLVALSQAFNKFYHSHTVLVDEPAQRAARLALTSAVRTVLRVGLALLGIAAPQRM